jgi:hypothetical protein
MSDPSDSSVETESFLRDTESVVSAMQVCAILIESGSLLVIDVIGLSLLLPTPRLESTAGVVQNPMLKLEVAAAIASPSILPPPLLN